MRTQILSYGGGIQTVAMIVLILKGRLPKPDMLVIADTSREKSSTWDYLAEVVQPALERQGMAVEIAGHELATVDLHSGNGDLLIPVFTETGKLPTFCSTEWKQRVVQRYLRSRGVEQADVWIGFSLDEERRWERARHDTGWYQRTFPLYDLGLTRADCAVIIQDYGWPLPASSACWLCPNMDDAEWHEMKRDYPEDFQKAIDAEAEIQQWDGAVWLTKHRKPLAEVTFDPNGYSKKESRMQCTMGCMI